MATDVQAERIELCIRECLQRAWRLAYAWTGDAHDAEDVVQQACIIAARKVADMPRGDTWPWFAAIVAFEARNHLRVKCRYSSAVKNSAGGVREMGRNGADPARDLERQELAARILAALDDLPEAERESVMLTQMSGLSYREAGSILGVDHSLVYQRVNSGLAKLRSRLGVSEPAVSASFAALPILVPPSGFESLLSASLSSAKAALAANVTSGTVSSGIIGGVIMAKKVTIAASLAVALGLGAVSGAFANDALRGEQSTIAATGSEETTQEDTYSGSTPSKHVEPGDAKALLAAQARIDEMERERQAFLTRQNQDAETIASLKRDIAEKSVSGTGNTADVAAAPVAKKAITFGGLGEGGEFDSIDWNKLGGSVLRLTQAVQKLRAENPNVSKGEVFNQLEKIVEKDFVTMVGSLLTLSGSVPSCNSGNGTLTHPMVMLNLMAAHLEAAGCPLTDGQVQQLVVHGVAYVKDAADRSATYNDQTLILERVVDEVELKRAFIAQVVTVLTVTQTQALDLTTANGSPFMPFYDTDNIFQSHAGISLNGNPAQASTLLKHDAQQWWKLDSATIQSSALVFDTWATELLACNKGDWLPCAKAELKAMKELIVTYQPGPESVAAMQDFQTTVYFEP